MDNTFTWCVLWVNNDSGLKFPEVMTVGELHVPDVIMIKKYPDYPRSAGINI